jgi:hypothetical protein
MAEKIKLNYSGEEVEALPVEINQSSEYWNQYLLDDGTIIKMKLVATKVFRVLDKYDEDANPIYLVKSTNIMAVNAAQALKKKTV